MGSSSLIRDQTWAPYTGSTKSQPLDHQESPKDITLRSGKRNTYSSSPKKKQYQPRLLSQAELEPYVHYLHGFRGRNKKLPIIFISHLHNGQKRTHSPQDNGSLFRPLGWPESATSLKPSRGQTHTPTGSRTADIKTLACFIDNNCIGPHQPLNQGASNDNALGLRYSTQAFCCCPQAFSSYDERVLLSFAVLELLIAVASLTTKHRF